MTPTRSEIEALVMRIQDEFLGTPAVRLTLDEIARRLNAGRELCAAVLGVLVDARVIAESSGGVFERYMPAPAGSRGRAA